VQAHQHNHCESPRLAQIEVTNACDDNRPNVYQRGPRMRLESPKSGKIQQGALFNCALVPGYEDCPCHGLILTARCDLEHGKYSVINYLPVVRFSDWAKREMCYLLARRSNKSLFAAIRTALTNKKVTEYVLGTFPLRDIIEKETSGKEQRLLLEKLAQLQMTEAVISLGGRQFHRSSELIEIEGKQCDALIKELIQGKLSEYYFLDAVDVTERSASGYVVLLRNMRMMSSGHASTIVLGLERECAELDTALMSILTFTHEPICMLTGVLRSPDIEHLAQYFANLFVKIGLEDYEDQTVTYHQNMAKDI
jgi:hypothetical protein